MTSHGGNLSARRLRGGALISATGAMLGRLSQQLLVAVDAGGAPLEAGSPAPSSDTAIHLAIYEAHPDAGAVLHAHPAHAVALAFERAAIEPANLEGWLFLGGVQVLDVAWEASAEPVAEALRECPVVVVRGHGSYARGRRCVGRAAGDLGARGGGAAAGVERALTRGLGGAVLARGQ